MTTLPASLCQPQHLRLSPISLETGRATFSLLETFELTEEVDATSTSGTPASASATDAVSEVAACDEGLKGLNDSSSVSFF